MPRNFGQNIIIDGGPGATTYEEAIVGELTQLLIFETARIVIHEIWRMHRRLRITPWTLAQINADTTPTRWADASPNGAPVLDGNGFPIGHLRGTGRGSDVIIRYTPKVFAADAGWNAGSRQAWTTVTGAPPPGPGSDQGEVLLHEMVHAYRMMIGVLHARWVSSQIDTREEFIAILVANLYSLERARPMRADHQSTQATTGDVSGWLTNPKFSAILWGAMADMPALTNALARVRVPQNPFAQYAVPTLFELVTSPAD